MSEPGAVRQKRYREAHPEYLERERLRHRRDYHNPDNAAALLKALMRKHLRYHEQRLQQLEQEE